jgi:hypothetical protein
MPDLNDFPTIDEFKVVPSIDGITFAVEFVDPHVGGLPYLLTEVFEFYLSDTDDFDAAIKVAEGLGAAKATGLSGGDTKYAWLRPRRSAGPVLGPVYPGSGGGVNDPGTPGSGIEVTVYSDTEQWVAYTPTVSSASGTITSASATGRYKVRGRSILVQTTYTVFTAGTGAGGLRISLPFPVVVASPNVFIGAGYISQGGILMSALATSNGAECLRYDGSTPIASGTSGIVQVEYEVD